MLTLVLVIGAGLPIVSKQKLAAIAGFLFVGNPELDFANLAKAPQAKVQGQPGR